MSDRDLCFDLLPKITVKVKVALYQAPKAQRGSRGIALLIHDFGARKGVGGQHNAPAALPPGKTRYPLHRRLGGPQGRSERVRKISSVPRFDPLTVQPVASRYTDWVLPAPDDNGGADCKGVCSKTAGCSNCSPRVRVARYVTRCAQSHTRKPAAV
jgi:hypothetical protein